jgi:NAD-dependent dihydropyrimidine dehydrogenase PreA subunit
VYHHLGRSGVGQLADRVGQRRTVARVGQPVPQRDPPPDQPGQLLGHPCLLESAGVIPPSPWAPGYAQRRMRRHTGPRERVASSAGVVVTYVIAEPCVDLKDKACIEECPVDCIYEGARMLYIHPDECVDCGACEPVCPVEAIYYEDDVPDQWKDYYKANVDFFEELGSPGGASKVGMIDRDHPLVAALPPQEHDE